jgi:hypothetical protein
VTGVADRQGLSFRDSTITFVFLTAIVAVLAVGILILLDPRSQGFWGARFSDLGTAVRSLVSQLPQLPWMR